MKDNTKGFGAATTWFCSDLHFFHKNIIKYTNRGKDTSVEHHDEWLVDLWNSQVKPEDTVWHLGDFSFGNYQKTLGFLCKLNGTKKFIKGNHDDPDMLTKFMMDGDICAWWEYKEIKIKGNNTCLFHFPIATWHRQHHGSWHLHGHNHGSYVGQGKILDVGLDSAYNLTGKHQFFTEDMIKDHMDSKEIYVPDHHTKREGE